MNPGRPAVRRDSCTVTMDEASQKTASQRDTPFA